MSILIHATKEQRQQAVGAEGKLRTMCYNSVLHGAIQRCLLLLQRKKEKIGQTSPTDTRGPSLHICKDTMKEMTLCPKLSVGNSIPHVSQVERQQPSILEAASVNNWLPILLNWLPTNYQNRPNPQTK